jgi:hypothetical protein
MSEANQPDTGRQEFEEFKRETGWADCIADGIFPAGAPCEGEYRHYGIQSQWVLWQAATRAAQAKIASLEANHRRLKTDFDEVSFRCTTIIVRLTGERDDWHNRATEAQAERDAAREERDAALVRVSAMEGEVTVPDDMQEWARLDGAVAWHLIERHADSWADVGKMMDEFIAARIDAARKQDIVSASTAAGEANP